MSADQIAIELMKLNGYDPNDRERMCHLSRLVSMAIRDVEPFLTQLVEVYDDDDAARQDEAAAVLVQAWWAGCGAGQSETAAQVIEQGVSVRVVNASDG